MLIEGRKMDIEKIKKIGVIGAGTIGSSWATFFAVKSNI
jgi:3-hydroxyacyl-CoA dehydrogenase